MAKATKKPTLTTLSKYEEASYLVNWISQLTPHDRISRSSTTSVGSVIQKMVTRLDTLLFPDKP